MCCSQQAIRNDKKKKTNITQHLNIRMHIHTVAYTSYTHKLHLALIGLDRVYELKYIIKKANEQKKKKK